MKNIYPTTKISTIKKYSKRTPGSRMFQDDLKAYKTKDFDYMYNVTQNEYIAKYKPTKQMFKWSSKTQKWRKLNYKPGQR